MSARAEQPPALTERRHLGTATEYRYSAGGELVCVVVAGDLVALPDEHWSCGNFGDGISEEWLLGGGSIPFPGKSKARRRLLAYFVRRALADHHGYRLEAGAFPGCG